MKCTVTVISREVYNAKKLRTLNKKLKNGNYDIELYDYELEII